MKLVTDDERRRNLVSKPNYYASKQFSENLNEKDKGRNEQTCIPWTSNIRHQ